MARPINRLTARTIATLKEPGRHADGLGLYLHIDERLSKRWVFVFQWRGARKEMGLGPVHDVGLAEARDARDRARKSVRDGKNPIEERRRARVTEAPTLKDAAATLQASLSAGWRNDKHRKQWFAAVERHAPKLLNRRVDEIETEHILEALKPIWQAKAETARRVRARIEAVLDAEAARGTRFGANPARLKGHLDKLLPKSERLTRGHHPAMPYPDVPAFMVELAERKGYAARALEFLILNGSREGEALGADWREVKGDLWTIPAERMKSNREHRVPLSGRALAVLDAIRPARPVGLIFPSARVGKPMSNMAMDMLLRRMERPFTVHGFRSTFRDWAGDCTTYPREIAEAALAHSVGNMVERAYRRGDALDRRRKLMESWAEFCYPATEDQAALCGVHFGRLAR